MGKQLNKMQSLETFARLDMLNVLDFLLMACV